MADDDLADFEWDAFDHGGKQRTVFRKGSGPAVIVMAEMPGITPKVAEFARRVAAIGCTAVMPHLFGEPGHDPCDGASRAAYDGRSSTLAPLASAGSSRRGRPTARRRSSTGCGPSPTHEHERCGGPGVGAIGMCFTGGFALAMATDPSLLAPVLSQPSMPMAMTQDAAAARSTARPPTSTSSRAAAPPRACRCSGCASRATGSCPPARFEFLREQLGDAFVAVELEDEAANPDAAMKPHSVLTEHLIDEPGQPTRAALDQVLDLFRTRLVVPPG